MDEPISFSTATHDATNPISEAVAANLAGGTQALTLGDLMHAMLDPLPSNATAETLRATPTAKVMAEAARPLFSAFGPILSAATGGLGQRGTANAANAAQMRAMRAELELAESHGDRAANRPRRIAAGAASNQGLVPEGPR